MNLGSVLPYHQLLVLMGNDTTAFLFDLDGTLLDTAPDLVGAANAILKKNNRAIKPYEALRPWVSQGGLKLMSIAFDIPKESHQAHELWHQYLTEYQSRITQKTQFFSGFEYILEKIHHNHLRWGIVTNKPEHLTHQILNNLHIRPTNDCVVCGDTLDNPKPSPDPVTYACKLLNVEPEQAVMVGDDERDIASGRSAGTATIAATWGYITPNDDPTTWQADAVMDQPLQLAGWMP